MRIRLEIFSLILQRFYGIIVLGQECRITARILQTRKAVSHANTLGNFLLDYSTLLRYNSTGPRASDNSTNTIDQKGSGEITFLSDNIEICKIIIKYQILSLHRLSYSQ